MGISVNDPFPIKVNAPQMAVDAAVRLLLSQQGPQGTAKIATGTYTGNGADGRVVSVGFTPVWGLVISRNAGGAAPMWVSAGASFLIYNSAVPSGGGTPGIYGSGSLGGGIGPVPGGFQVNAGYSNSNGQTYSYVMIG